MMLNERKGKALLDPGEQVLLILKPLDLSHISWLSQVQLRDEMQLRHHVGPESACCYMRRMKCKVTGLLQQDVLGSFSGKAGGEAS